MAYTDVLRDLGLTQREVKVYLALLELGSSTVGPIVQIAGIQHSKIYESLDKLIDKGLASYVVVGKTKHFQASPPKTILNMLDEKRRRFQEVLQELELKQKYSSQKQMAVVYEGYKSFKALFDRIADEIKPGESYWTFAFKNEYYLPAASLLLRRFHEKLGKKHVDDRALGHISVKDAIKKTFEGNKNIKLRFTSTDAPLGIIIIKDRVITLTWGERPTAIEMTSPQIYENYKAFFLDVWNKAR